jgi:hypothetical protein
MRKFKRILTIAIGGLVLSAVLPATTLAQGRWFVRPRHRSVVVFNYQPRPYVVYTPRPYYSYAPAPYYSSYGYSYYPSGDYRYWYRPHRNHFRFGVFVR